MKAVLIILITLTVLGIIYLLTLKGRSNTDMSKFKGYHFAHRGLFKTGVIPENSMAAFAHAKERGFGVELDVHLLADRGLAVIHDDSLKRTTGVERNVSELTTDELGMYYLEGTSETIPNFHDVLKFFNGEVPLIIELKGFDKRYKELCKAVCDALAGYKGDYCIESFDPRCILWLKQNRPDIIRGQLSFNYVKNSKIKNFITRFLLTLLVTNVINKPDFIAYSYQDRSCLPYKISKKLWKLQGVSWTLRSQEELETAVNDDEIVIFEGFIPE